MEQAYKNAIVKTFQEFDGSTVLEINDESDTMGIVKTTSGVFTFNLAAYAMHITADLNSGIAMSDTDRQRLICIFIHNMDVTNFDMRFDAECAKMKVEFDAEFDRARAAMGESYATALSEMNTEFQVRVKELQDRFDANAEKIMKS